ncbi:leucine rich adaptor protein 1-like [Acipenser ruthenus]|uniref:leucine rich adaptor protein 1-like n=1 Tax=Acipenser ruthenus TaxID=7906 RepID=UPI00145B050C|nr:leucine rich adaptor protein 1-like [Acipenser ruthenus]
MVDETISESLPDLKDVESKIGRKTPEGLLRWLREDSALLLGDNTLNPGESKEREPLPGKKGLAEKIRDLKLEMAYLRSIDVKILQQLVTVNEGIEAVKWILEEKGNLASRCSSLTSSQYSLVESQETSRRGSWNSLVESQETSSLQDPNDKLDNISIGSYLDTLADDMDEYCPSSSESAICSTVNGHSGPCGRSDHEQQLGGGGGKACGQGSPLHRTDLFRENQGWSKPAQDPSKVESNRLDRELLPSKSRNVGNGYLDKPGADLDHILETRPPLADKPYKGSPKLNHYKNGKIDLDSCKLNTKIHLEYDAHWRWVQSQDDVTFL